MIFVTVGTTHPFDRLIRAVDRAIERGLIRGEVFAQVGKTAFRPLHFVAVPSMEKTSFDAKLRDASAIISHAGMGILTQALQAAKPVLVLPRLARHGEVVNDHQVALAENFGRAGHILVAHDEQELYTQIPRLESFVPIPRSPQRARLIQRVSALVDSVAATRDRAQKVAPIR